jgi:hypothetical protein
LTWPGEDHLDSAEADSDAADQASSALVSQLQLVKSQVQQLTHELQMSDERAFVAEQGLYHASERIHVLEQPQAEPEFEPEPEPEYSFQAPTPAEQPEPEPELATDGVQQQLRLVRSFLQYKGFEGELADFEATYAVDFDGDVPRGREAELEVRTNARKARAKPRWIASKSKARCQLCAKTFGVSNAKTRCFYCGWVVCTECAGSSLEVDRWLSQVSPHEIRWPGGGHVEVKQVCDLCFREAPAEMHARRKAIAEQGLARQYSIEGFQQRMKDSSVPRIAARLSSLSADEMGGAVPADVFTAVTSRVSMQFHRTAGEKQIGGMMSSSLETMVVWLTPEERTIHWQPTRHRGRDRSHTEKVVGILPSGLAALPIISSAQRLHAQNLMLTVATEDSHITLLAPDHASKVQWLIGIQAALDEAAYVDQAVTQRSLVEGITYQQFEALLAESADEIGCPHPTTEAMQLRFQQVKDSASVAALNASPPGRISLADLVAHIGLAGQVHECALCMDELEPSGGVFCDGTAQRHFYCFECFAAGIKAECAGPTGRFQQDINAECRPGDFPCPMFPDECDCGRMDRHQLYRTGVEDSEAADAYERASNRVAIIKGDEEQRQVADRAVVKLRVDRASLSGEGSGTPLECLRRAVEIALDEGSCVRCPSCGTHAIKDGACMHMNCSSCRAKWCYCCGRRAGTSAGTCRQGHGEGGCDSVSLFLERTPGWDNFAIPRSRESKGDGARQEFHRRRMTYFVRLVKEQTTDELWAALRSAHPELLRDTPSLGRHIQWGTISNAQPPLFGGTTAADLPPLPDLRVPAPYERPSGDAAKQLVLDGDKHLLHKPELNKESHNRFFWVVNGTGQICWGKQWQRENYLLWRTGHSAQVQKAASTSLHSYLVCYAVCPEPALVKSSLFFDVCRSTSVSSKRRGLSRPKRS